MCMTGRSPRMCVTFWKGSSFSQASRETSTSTQVRTHTHTHTHPHRNKHTYTHTHTHTHRNKHTYTHTHSPDIEDHLGYLQALPEAGTAPIRLRRDTQAHK